MESADLLKLLGGGGVSAALLLVIYKAFLYLIREWVRAQKEEMARIVDVIKELVVVVRAHTTTDLEHHAEVKEAVIRLEAKVDQALDGFVTTLTPIHGVPAIPKG